MDEGTIAGIIFSTLLFVVVPLVYMFIKHQQKMTEMIHGKPGQLPQTYVANDPALVSEIARLRDVVAQQTIAIDNLNAAHRRLEAKLTETDDVRTRLQA